MGGGAREIHAIEIPLVHVQQHLSWDCGVSAVMMVLKYVHIIKIYFVFY